MPDPLQPHALDPSPLNPSNGSHRFHGFPVSLKRTALPRDVPVERGVRSDWSLPVLLPSRPSLARAHAVPPSSAARRRSACLFNMEQPSRSTDRGKGRCWRQACHDCSREAPRGNGSLEATQLVTCQVTTEVLYLKHSHTVNEPVMLGKNKLFSEFRSMRTWPHLGDTVSALCVLLG